jgi:hypothetical protein
VDRLLAPWTDALGADYAPYRNHVVRVLELCDCLAERQAGGDDGPTRQTQFLAAAVFHDLGIWSAHTFDYLAPSIVLASEWLAQAGREDLTPVVAEMIDQHHKLRPAGAPESAVELFRRADTIDVTLGVRRFGVALPRYREILARYPDQGFHRRLIVLTAQRVRTHPLSPLPMFKW